MKSSIFISLLAMVMLLVGGCGTDSSIRKCICSCAYIGDGTGACGDLMKCDDEDEGCLTACDGVCEAFDTNCVTENGTEASDSIDLECQ